jgi:hypothetical protein
LQKYCLPHDVCEPQRGYCSACKCRVIRRQDSQTPCDMTFFIQIGVVYRFFRSQDDFKWKKFELQSYKSRRRFQFSYTFYLHPSSYKKVTAFEKEPNPTAVWYDGWNNLAPPTTVWYVFGTKRHVVWRY